MRIWR